MAKPKFTKKIKRFSKKDLSIGSFIEQTALMIRNQAKVSEIKREKRSFAKRPPKQLIGVTNLTQQVAILLRKEAQLISKTANKKKLKRSK